MNYDILILIVLVGWSIARVIEKEVIKTPSSKDFTKLIILIGAVLVLPLIPLVHFTSANIMAAILFLGILWILELFVKFLAIKKEEVSRVSAFIHFKFLFAMILVIIFLGETANINTLLGGLAMILGGFLIGFEKDKLKGKLSNKAIYYFLLAMFFSGVSYTIREYILQFVDPFSVMFFSTLFAGLLILPTAKKLPKIPKFRWLVFAQILMSGGYLLILWIMSKQELVYIAPILAVQPLIILLLSRKFLKESQGFFLNRIVAISLMILGYLILKGVIL